jgi:hypothetical protein
MFLNALREENSDGQGRDLEDVTMQISSAMAFTKRLKVAKQIIALDCTQNVRTTFCGS